MKNKKILSGVVVGIILVLVIGCMTYFKSKSEEKIVIPTTHVEEQNSEKEQGNESSSNNSSQSVPYEYWIAAASLTGISMQYENFDKVEYYIADKTSLGDKNSQGIYIKFEVNGKKKYVYSKPLSQERSEKNTKDVYSEVIGYATFDEVKSIKDNFHSVSIDNIDDLIKNSVRVLVSEH